MDSPKSKQHPTVDSELTTDPDAKVESDPDIKPDSETHPKAESDPNSKPDSNPQPSGGSNPDPRTDSDLSPAAAIPWQSDIAHDRFTQSLVAFHADRGTQLDLEPRVSSKDIDLNTLYNAVIARGGYDAVCNEKLAWRKVGEIFHLPTINAAAHAFALKSVYYYNLAAYEIKYFHHREPPPKEILEELTPKGGDLLNRTLENYQPSAKKLRLSNEPSAMSGDEAANTPNEDKPDAGDPTDPSAGGVRTMRGLRKAPAQRIPFSPDVSSTRQGRHPSTYSQSPSQPGNDSATNSYHQSNSDDSYIATTIKNYEPTPPIPLTLRSVVTPRNNPGLFNEKLRVAQEAKAAQSGQGPSSVADGMMKPGAGYEGPNIYVRILLSLRSTVPAEQDYALHHLVKISHERGDKYKVEAFPTLAETLIEYALGVSSLFYNVRWEVDYTEKKFDLNTLDGINGTPDILQRIQSLKRIDTSDELEPEELAHKFTKINEAGLALRNLTTLEENAQYLSTLPQLRDFLPIVLNLPSSDRVTELKLNVLDIAEEVTKYWSMDVSDPLYRSLLVQVETSNDRGFIIRALRAICNTSLERETSNQIRGVPIAIIRRLFEWLLLEDEELMKACLDFLYQFVAVSDNVGLLIANAEKLSLSAVMTQFGQLLQHGIEEVTEKVLVYPVIPPAPAKEIPIVPPDLLSQFLQCDEPERSNRWLKSVVEENPESDITQIALWQAYQAAFSRFATPQKGLLLASDFIKNVSTVFAGANAQVVTGPSSKFIIKGIQPRHAPIDTHGRTCLQCKWKPPNQDGCQKFFLTAADLYYHFLGAHLGLSRGEDNRWISNDSNIDTSKLSDCYWDDCHHFSRLKSDHPPPSSGRLAQHLRQHLPYESTKTPMSPSQPIEEEKKPYALVTNFTPESLELKPTPENFPMGRPAIYKEIKYEITPVDEHGDPAGIALCALLVLRNIARNLPEALFLLGGQYQSPTTTTTTTTNNNTTNNTNMDMDFNFDFGNMERERGRALLAQRGDPVGSVEAWMNVLFGGLKWPLVHLWASNRAVGTYAFDTLVLVGKFQGV